MTRQMMQLSRKTMPLQPRLLLLQNRLNLRVKVKTPDFLTYTRPARPGDDDES